MALGWRDQYLRYREFFLNIQTLYKKRADLRAFVELVLSISTVIIFLNFALKPTALTIITLYNDIQEKQRTIAALDQKIANLVTASNLLSQNQNFLADIDISVSDMPRPDRISQQLQALAIKDGVSLVGISVGQAVLAGQGPSIKPAPGLSPLPGGSKSMDLSFSIKGDYPGLVAFIKDFENLRIISKVDIDSITASKTEKGQAVVTVTTGRVPFLGITAQTQQ